MEGVIFGEDCEDLVRDTMRLLSTRASWSPEIVLITLQQGEQVPPVLSILLISVFTKKSPREKLSGLFEVFHVLRPLEVTSEGRCVAQIQIGVRCVVVRGGCEYVSPLMNFKGFLKIATVKSMLVAKPEAVPEVAKALDAVLGTLQCSLLLDLLVKIHNCTDVGKVATALEAAQESGSQGAEGSLVTDPTRGVTFQPAFPNLNRPVDVSDVSVMAETR